MKKSVKIILASMMAVVSIGAFAGCGKSENSASSDAGSTSTKSSSAAIAVSGSTSMGKLMENEAEAYEGANSGVSIEIQQIGSSAGIKNVISGVSEIGMASRELKAEEKSEVKETTVAYDGIALAVSKENKATDITIEQMKKIFTGEITNWKDLGGDDAPIVVVSREEGSGTRDAFQEIVGYTSDDMIKDATVAEGNGAVKSTVAGNKNAVGYISFEVLDDSVKALDVEGVTPLPENVQNKTYKLSRPFLLVYKDGKLSEQGNKFMEYILSDEGQNIVEKSGGIKVK